MGERIIVLLDMDCFYVQVEERDNPDIKGKPAAVVQYNTWKGGGIIAVNYEARAYGVKRGMRGDEAKEKCSSIHLVQVPVQRGKADLTKYRNAGKEVVDVLCKFSDVVERASIDEAYIDFTKAIEDSARFNSSSKALTIDNLHSTWVVGYDEEEETGDSQSTREEGLRTWLEKIKENSNSSSESESIKLGMAALICEEMRSKVFEETGFKCSAGISLNKMLAKLACGLHKPNQQTILPKESVPALWAGISIGKVRNLGGKLGDSLKEDLNCETMGDLAKLSLDQLRVKFDEKTSHWLFGLGRGVDNEAVTARQLPKSIGCGKNFNGKDILNTKEKVNIWMRNLSEELSERLNEDKDSNERVAKTLTVHVRLDVEDKPVSSRSCQLPSYKSESIGKVALNLILSTNTAPSKDDKWDPPIRNISLSASKFEDLCTSGTAKIDSIFKVVDPTTALNNSLKDIQPLNNSTGKNICKKESDIRQSKKSELNEKNKNKAEGSPQSSFFLKFLTAKKDQKSKKNLNLETVSGSENKDEASQVENVKDDDDSCSPDIFDLSTDVDENEDCRPNQAKDSGRPDISPVIKSKRRRTLDKDDRIEKGGDGVNGDTKREAVQPSSNAQEGNLSDENAISVRDLFPDLNKVDWSLVDVLPSPFKERVYAEVKRHQELRNDKKNEVIDLTVEAHSNVQKPSNSCNSNKDFAQISGGSAVIKKGATEGYTFCRECNRKILNANYREHEDYHFAMELRKEQINEAKASVVTKTKQTNTKASSSKGKKVKSRNVENNSSTPKIQNFFKKL